jgi:hypothetical protein
MNEHFGREIDPQPPVQPPFTISAPEIGHQVVRGHEICRLSGLNGRFSQRHGQMRLPYARRPQKDDV